MCEIAIYLFSCHVVGPILVVELTFEICMIRSNKEVLESIHYPTVILIYLCILFQSIISLVRNVSTSSTDSDDKHQL